jgi:hypothetical protein
MSDDISIIGPKIYSPLPKTAERSEIPVQCEAPWEIKWVPITAPPPDCREVSLAPQLYDEYDQALKSYLDNAELKRKFNRGRPLSPAETEVMGKIKTAETNIYRYGVTLLSAALLSEKPSQNSLELWRDFATRAEQMPINLTRANTLFLLADPKLSRGDRKLLLDYCTSASGEIKPIIPPVTPSSTSLPRCLARTILKNSRPSFLAGIPRPSWSVLVKSRSLNTLRWISSNYF